jgi:hypothetical protein
MFGKNSGYSKYRNSNNSYRNRPYGDNNSQYNRYSNSDSVTSRHGHNGQGRNNFSTDDQSNQRYPRSSYLNNRHSPYDGNNCRNQSSKSRNIYPESSVHEEQENPRPVSFQPSNEYLGGWEEENNNEPIEKGNRKVAAGDFSSLKLNPSIKASGVFKGKETKPSTDSSTMKAADDDEVDWVFSDTNQFTSSSSAAIRPQSPMLYEFMDKEDDNKKVSRNNKGKFKAPQDQYYEEEFPNNREDDYKGISFHPPFPIVPVSSDIEQPICPDIGRIFENDSRSSAQSFENLSKLARSLWDNETDVPLDLASKQDVNPEEYLRLNGEKLKETSVEFSNKNNKNDIEPEWPKKRGFSPCNSELTDNQSLPSTYNQSSSFTENQSFSFTENHTTSRKPTLSKRIDSAYVNRILMNLSFLQQ